ncbi:hypothetical protein [Corynebacterium striatum]|nr:hypothetical protein [Corynebacterium striatum]
MEFVLNPASSSEEDDTVKIEDWCRFVVVGTGNPRSWYRVSG